MDLPNLPSNRIAGQLWCIVGARESYTRQSRRAAGRDFVQPHDAACQGSGAGRLGCDLERLGEIDFAGLSETQLDLAFELLEHEVQHHGQLIRFVYANGLTFPVSWHERYTV